MKDVSLIEPVFKNVILTVNSNLKILMEDYTVYDVYNPSTLHGAQLTYSPFKHWKPERRIFVKDTKHEHMYWVRRNMSGILFKAMVVV